MLTRWGGRLLCDSADVNCKFEDNLALIPYKYLHVVEIHSGPHHS